jgi:hypothetical protein
MATRSRIAIETQDGIISIYCHWDGHIETNGKILFENYDREKTEQLIALGNISSLGTLLEPTITHLKYRRSSIIVIITKI